MPYTIMSLLSTVVEGEKLPVVDGATDVTKEADGKYIAYGDFVPGANTKWMRGPDQVVAVLYELVLDTYVIVAEQETINAIDIFDEGQTATEAVALFDGTVPIGSIADVDFDAVMGRNVDTYSAEVVDIG